LERYAPPLKVLAPRDVVSRSIYREIREGRGIGGRDYVYLDFRHLGPDVLDHKLPDVAEFVSVYMALDPATELVPIQPTEHYAMGGIPTDIDGRVIFDEHNTPVHGLYAAGECACVSVHGANRLGTNSLLDILVFGRRVGQHVLSYIREGAATPAPAHNPDSDVRVEIGQLLTSSGTESVASIRMALQELMTDKVSVFRTATDLATAVESIHALEDRYRHVKIDDRGKQFNTALLEVLELGYLLDLAEATAVCALHRTESRGAHYREDFPRRDDANWLHHTLCYRKEGTLEFRHKPVVITRFPPQERKY
jgi:succinate dehydrogenase / fumarate reductase flavoprotein subunit